jgi:hypothetical protein
MRKSLTVNLILLSAFLVVISVSCSRNSGELPDEFPLTKFSGQYENVDNASNPLGETCLLMTPSGRLELPGVSGKAPWDKYNYLVFDVYHDAMISAAIRLKFTEKGDSEPSFNVRLGTMPALRTRLVFPLTALDAQKVFLPRTPGQLKAVLIGRRTRPELIESVAVTLDSMAAGQKLYVTGIKLTRTEPTEYPLDAPPVIDSLGQWTARDWPGKTKSVSELKANLNAGLAESAGSSFPDGWSRYGGWQGLKFDATGYFRVEHTPERWWLVDPEGCAFFSAGVDGISPLHAGCPLNGIEPLFEWIPARDGEYAPVWSDHWGQGMCDFAGANLITAFGVEWREKWGELSRGRLVNWRFNTLGNWTDREVTGSFGLPYVIPLREFPSTGKMIYRDFPDVFDPAYAAAADEFATQLEGYRDDPLLIGYFLANEPQWSFGNEIPASAMLETGERSATRDSLTAWLAARYDGEIAALNTAWSARFASFDELAEGALRRAGEMSAASRTDLNEFSKLMVIRYLEPVVNALRKVDPNHLNLGIRWAGMGSDFTELGGRFCDVFTVNMYSMLPDTTVLRTISEATGKPVLIGEYHFGATDRGLPSTGLRGVADQTQRGVAYRAYVECAAAQPYMVGTHYFIWNDQPAFGRFDGENYNIGLVDVCNTPYREFVDAARLTHERMYEVAAGKAAPFDQVAEIVPRVGF